MSRQHGERMRTKMAGATAMRHAPWLCPHTHTASPSLPPFLVSTRLATAHWSLEMPINGLELCRFEEGWGTATKLTAD